ncbi:hypothetical protein B0T10DRAFT_303697 [Thelonectria olida]|uniref:Uncharacterized protein n=1 Tax=Thelonectria olida TaxID=1576542 RepID=A0A9P8W8X7_9HYPO|nr:hypothetical protein B0T10DRAFT_303697 [Thelonectria olida]
MSEPKKEPTAAEAMLFFSIVKNTRNKADVDWDVVASEQGFKNAEVAKVRFGQVKRKLGISSDPAAAGGSPGSAKKGANGNGAAAGPITPSKVTKTPRKGKGGRGKVKKEEPREDDEDRKDLIAPVKAELDGSDDGDEGANGQLQSEMMGAAAVDPF